MALAAAGRASRMISPDRRLQAYGLLLVPAFMGHTLQLMGEDRPWEPHAWPRYWYQPGWHLFLPPWLIVAIAVALAGVVVGLAVRRTRPWLVALVVIYLAHYLTYPYRIRNHMSHMFFGLSMLGAVWLGGRLLGVRAPRDSRGETWWTAVRDVDRFAVRGLAMVLCTTYFFAGLHKTNANFLSIGSESAAAGAITQFWLYADLGEVPPDWVKWCAAYGTVAIECGVPIVAWRSRILRVPALLILMAFHYPMVSAMNVSDYPMIVSASYPCLFSEAHFRLLLRHLRRLTPWTVGGAIFGAAAQVWADRKSVV